MTEYELVDAAASYTGLLQSWLMSYFTVLTAYLITAYVAGQQLTTFQAVVVTTCFLVLCSLTAIATTGAGFRFVELTQEITTMNSGRVYLVSPTLMWACVTTLYIGIFVALIFMWQVRHPKE